MATRKRTTAPTADTISIHDGMALRKAINRAA